MNKHQVIRIRQHQYHYHSLQFVVVLFIAHPKENSWHKTKFPKSIYNCPLFCMPKNLSYPCFFQVCSFRPVLLAQIVQSPSSFFQLNWVFLLNAKSILFPWSTLFSPFSINSCPFFMVSTFCFKQQKRESSELFCLVLNHFLVLY